MAVGMTGRLLAGRYRTIRRLGSGGMATVFLAEDERLGRPVAVKRLHGDVSDDDLVKRFRREARLGASLNHPNVVAVYDIASDDEGVLIVMEYVEGHTLRDEIARGAVPAERALPILRGVAGALDHAHGLGVLHRDVKPANVLLRRDGAVKLADLGIATAAEDSRITRTGSVLGTATYMAPERLDGGSSSAAADVYALAAVAFEALSGRRAVEGTTPLEVAQRVVNQPPPDLGDALPGAPPAAAEVLRRGLARDPAERPASAGALVDELERAFRSPRERPTAATAPLAGAAAPPPSASDRVEGPPATGGRRPLRPIVLAAAAALLLIGVIVALASGGGGSNHGAASSTGTHGEQKRHTSRPVAPVQGGSSASQSGASPAVTVSDFYQRSARHDYEGALSLVTDRGRQQLGGASLLAAGQSTLRSISFPLLQTTSQTGSAATVELRSIAVHSGYTDRCAGSVDLVKSGSGWLLDVFHIASCQRTGGASPAPGPPGHEQGKGFGHGKGHGKLPKPSEARGSPGASGGD